MNWPWNDEPMQAWSPPAVGRWAVVLAVPVPHDLELMEEDMYRSLLAKRVQWMLDRSDLTLHEFHRMVWEAGEVGLSMGGVDLETAGEQLVMESALVQRMMSQLLQLPARVANLAPEDAEMVADLLIEEWVLELGTWAGR